MKRLLALPLVLPLTACVDSAGASAAGLVFHVTSFSDQVRSGEP